MGVAHTPTVNLTTIKTHFNIMIYTEGEKYMCMDAKDFYVNTPMSHY